MGLFADHPLLTLAVTLFAIVYTYFKWSFKYWPCRGVVVPFEPIFPFGNFGRFFTRTKGHTDIANENYWVLKKLGLPYGGNYFITAPQLIIVDPDIVRLIMASEYQHFESRGIYCNVEKNPLSRNIFNIHGARWKYLRANLTPTFTSGKMKMMFHTLIDYGHNLVENIAECSKNQAPIDIKEQLGKFSTDVICSCAFGMEYGNCNELNAKEITDYVFSLSLIGRLYQSFGTVFPNAARTLGLEPMDKKAIDFFMNIFRSNIAFREKNNYKRNDFLQLLLGVQQKSKEDGSQSPITFEEVVAQAAFFFVAGFETSATTMTFTLYELAKHQDIQMQVRAEIETVVKQHDGNITYDAIQEMKLLKCVVDGEFWKYMYIYMNIWLWFVVFRGFKDVPTRRGITTHMY